MRNCRIFAMAVQASSLLFERIVVLFNHRDQHIQIIGLDVISSGSDGLFHVFGAVKRPQQHIHKGLQAGLVAAGLEVVPSRANFFLVRPSPDTVDGPARSTRPTALAMAATEALFERLLRSGILARHTHGFPGLEGGWLRLALRDREANDRLLAALGEGRRP